ncbi:MAG: ShlB/FhaC/HecB family hemolysin secretion/activation protein [Rhodocyclaceae bacterium]|nr:ShlB/FhaC/HecB family hemolysin secretion/activation protein [Rhodocyclaceae bacterium]
MDMPCLPSRFALAFSAGLLPVLAPAQLAPLPLPETPDPSLDHQRHRERSDSLRRTLEQPTDVHRPAQAADDGTLLPSGEQPCFTIRRIDLAGDAAHFPGLATALAGADGRDSPAGRCLGQKGVALLARRLQNALLSRGYITSRVAVPAQDLAAGTLQIEIRAGRVDRLRFADDDGPRTSLAGAMPIAAGQILDLRDVEQGLENLKRIPSADADIEIRPASTPAASDLVVHYVATSPWHVTLLADDGGRKATGRYQGGITVAYDNPLGANDLAYLALSHDLMADGARRGTWGVLGHYSVPLGYWNLALTAGRNRDRQTVQGATTRYIYGGFSGSAELELTRIVHRDARAKTWLGAGAWRRTSRNYIDDTEVAVQRRETAGWRATAGHRRFAGAAIIDARIAYRHGTGAFGAIPAPEEPFGDGTSRIRKTTADLQVDVPLTAGGRRLDYAGALRVQWNHSLLNPQELFVIGGRYSVRGFDGENVLAGERGWVLRNELSLPIAGASGFAAVDHGRVAGRSADRLAGRRLTGAVLGVRGAMHGAHYELFVGAPLDKPSRFEAPARTAGFRVAYTL